MVFVVAIALNHSTERVFEELKTDVGEMSGYVGKVEILRTNELDWRSFEHCVVFFTDKPGVFDSFLEDIVYILGQASKSIVNVRRE